MTDEEAEANARSDPDNPPLTSEQLRAAPRMPQVKVIRRAFGLTQEEFAARYQARSARYAIGNRGARCPIRLQKPI
jgi:DNA-binding transcriptional regulator YiaG